MKKANKVIKERDRVAARKIWFNRLECKIGNTKESTQKRMTQCLILKAGCDVSVSIGI